MQVPFADTAAWRIRLPIRQADFRASEGGRKVRGEFATVKHATSESLRIEPLGAASNADHVHVDFQLHGPKSIIQRQRLDYTRRHDGGSLREPAGRYSHNRRHRQRCAVTVNENVQGASIEFQGSQAYTLSFPTAGTTVAATTLTFQSTLSMNVAPGASAMISSAISGGGNELVIPNTWR